MATSIVFTGGGTAGHVIPNTVLIKALEKAGHQTHYVGERLGIEEALVSAMHVPFYGISAGKFRRYFTWKHFMEPFKVLQGTFQAYRILGNIKPDLVFSKGGFVAFPVVFAAWCRGIPVIVHESDLTPGLANRLSTPFAKRVCLTFPMLSPKKTHIVTGTPLRESLFIGDKAKGLALCGFKPGKPCLLVMGGSLGSQALNKVIRDALPALCEQYQVIHLCGSGKIDPQLTNHPGYMQFEFVNEALPDLFAAASIILSRAGANSVCELLALKKTHVLVPLPLKASRGDQIQNAAWSEKQGLSTVIQEADLNANSLLDVLARAKQQSPEQVARMMVMDLGAATDKILMLMREWVSV